jgi:alpha/beta superfamily hydrolase
MATGHSQDSSSVFPSMVEAHGHPERDGYVPLTVSTARGLIEARLFEAPEPLAGIVLVGNAGGDFESPADGLYDRLGETLSKEGIAVLRLRFREPSQLPDAEHDVLAGCRVLLDLGVERLGLVGHGFGGAAVLRAAAWEPEAQAIVTLAAQSPGDTDLKHLPKRHVLLVHGKADTVQPATASEQVHSVVGDKAELTLIDGAGHRLDEAAPAVFRQVHDWLLAKLSG